MTTITIHSDSEDSKLQQAISYLKKIGLRFSIDSEANDEDMLKERESVRRQIHNKYVTTSEWYLMDDDQKQDIVLVETMMYRQKHADRSALSADETTSLLTQLAEGTYGN